VHFTIYMYLYLYSYRRETTRQLRMYAQLTRCFSAVAELLVTPGFKDPSDYRNMATTKKKPLITKLTSVLCTAGPKNK